jgi:WD40 repeat protein
VYAEKKHKIGHTKKINMICISNDGKKIVSCGNDKTIRIWNIDNGK